jgi:SAM-dependent methyltransferase
VTGDSRSASGYDRSAGGDAYERYIGRWSRPLADEFVNWVEVPPGQRWLDVGCGTGALSQAILKRYAPAALVGVDPLEPARSVSKPAPGRSERAGLGIGRADDGSISPSFVHWFGSGPALLALREPAEHAQRAERVPAARLALARFHLEVGFTWVDVL